MDGSFLELIQRWIIELGPWVVFLVTMLETAAFVGLFIPSGPTILFAAFLATTRFFELEHVLLATLLGGLTGDQLGYWLGRAYGVRGVVHGGRVGRLWHRYEHRAVTLFRRHSIIAVSLARCIAFVRTIMPWFAGMSRMPYGRFFAYDVAGVLVWGVGHVALGYLAGRSWAVLATWLGSATLALLVIIAIAGLAVYLRRRRHAHGETVTNGLFRVGLTGNIASGKSAVEAVWTSLGAHVVDADVLAREAVAPGSEGLQRVAAHFGPDVLQPDGALDRSAMRDVAFRDDEARTTLESILHPEIERLRLEREDALRAIGARIVVHAIPLLYEVGMDDAFDMVVLVDAPAEERLRRLVETRGLQEAEARRMIDAQMPAAGKRERATIVIDNDGTLADLEQKAAETWREIERRAGTSG
ncbi:MAG: dephospho-CoA kinase [Longimicrobiales bacterium]